jgi:hypothetical protein
MVKRHCAICKEEFDFHRDYKNITIAKSTLVHKDCFRKSKMSLKTPWSDSKIDQYISEHEQETVLKIRAIQLQIQESGRKAAEKQKAQKERADNLALTDWLLNTYKVLIPRYFYIKLASVYNGTYRGLPGPIPPDDLLDMWQQKWKYLQKSDDYRRAHGREIDGANRLSYDLAIIIGKYDSYLKWKRTQEVAKQKSIEENSNVAVINYSALVGKEKCKEKTEDIDDIFGDID